MAVTEQQDARSARIVWADLEMTGLVPERERIIEIAMLITDGELNVVAEGPNLVVHQPEERLAAMEPRGYRGWAEAARKGLEAAQEKDMVGVRASCKACHDEQRERYRTELRAAALPVE